MSATDMALAIVPPTESSGAVWTAKCRLRVAMGRFVTFLVEPQAEAALAR